MPTGFQSYVLNSRKLYLQDVRVREALGLALDYEWMNRQMFYGAYLRVRGIFGNTPCATQSTRFKAEVPGWTWKLWTQHTGYFDAGSESLFSIADVTSGNGDLLQDHGMTAPHRDALLGSLSTALGSAELEHPADPTPRLAGRAPPGTTTSRSPKADVDTPDSAQPLRYSPRGMSTQEFDHPFFARVWSMKSARESQALRDLEAGEPVGPSGRVLEVGAGTGTNFRVLPRYGARSGCVGTRAPPVRHSDARPARQQCR